MQESCVASISFAGYPLFVGLQPLVSIIVPIYNAEKYINRCLDSLLSQTLRTIEIICVNDGSTDNSLRVLNEYSKIDGRIRVFNQENRGPGSARNTALDNVKGKYILFCDSDDTLEMDVCHECSTIMEKENVDMVVFNSKFIEVDRSDPTRKDCHGKYIYVVNESNAGLLNKKGCIKISILSNVWGYLFRTDLINRYNLRFTNYRIGEDTIFLHSYLITTKTGYAVKKVFYNHYMYKGSLAGIGLDKPALIRRFSFLPKLLFNTFLFSLKNKMCHREIYIFYWFFIRIWSRK
jgi:glycosyltransferase involved in cell wall biosynthesis